MITAGILIVLLVFGMFYGISQLMGMKHGLWYLSIYLLLCAITFVISKQYKNKIVTLIYQVLALPFRIVSGFMPLAMPYVVLQIHLFIYLFVSAAIPLCFYVLDRATGLFDLKITTHIYIIVTFSVITATLVNKQVKYLTYLFSPVRLYSSNISKRLEFSKLTDYFLSENNIKFIIYFCYFLYLLIFNLFTFQEHSLYSSPLMDRAVLQSFITFLALERLITNLKELDFKPSELLKLLLTSITGEEKVHNPKENEVDKNA